MAKPSFLPKTPDHIRADILPPGFDLDVISSFFARGTDAPPARLVPDTASRPADPSSESAAHDALVMADSRSEADLATLIDNIFADNSPETPDAPDLDADTDDSMGGGAKPAFGGGRTKDGSTDGGTKGGGKGKNAPKDDTTNDPPPSDPIDPPAEPTDETSPDPAPEPAPAPAPAPDTNPVPEVNLGSSDPNVYVSGLNDPYGFNIEIVWIGAWTDALKEDVIFAAENISALVTGDLPNHNGIDDIRIEASITTIDGAGGAWAWGGYTSLRPDSFLPSQGYIKFDSADLTKMQNYDLVDDFAFHEMLHAMGFGTAWQRMGLVEDHGGDLRFVGENATATYNDIYAMLSANDPLSHIGVPVETDGGAGTAGVHWDHDTFGNEIMTGTLAMNNVISDLTIAALEDMGYETSLYNDDFLFA